MPAPDSDEVDELDLRDFYGATTQFIELRK